MARYKITTTVEAPRQDSVIKKLKAAFGEESEIFSVEKLTTPESRARIGLAKPKSITFTVTLPASAKTTIRLLGLISR